jgi:hypothetical protein
MSSEDAPAAKRSKEDTETLTPAGEARKKAEGEEQKEDTERRRDIRAMMENIEGKRKRKRTEREREGKREQWIFVYHHLHPLPLPHPLPLYEHCRFHSTTPPHVLFPSAAVRKEKEKDSGNPIVFMDVEVQGKNLGRMKFELFADTCPKTAENFRQFCTGEKRSVQL